MSETIISRVAQALEAAAGRYATENRYHVNTLDDIPPEYLARAAIEAMTRPNKEMVKSGADHIPWEDGWGSPDASIRKIWISMIDAALKD